MNWSGGKDSALAVYWLQKGGRFQLDRLVTNINLPEERVTMHGVPLSLIKAQAERMELPLTPLRLPKAPDMATYNAAWRTQLDQLRLEGLEWAVFGDIFLEDLRTYRDQQLRQAGWQAYYPLWQQDTRTLLEQFIDRGFRARIVSCDADLFGADWGGRELNSSFLRDLPAGVDPCGERGEFHSFVYDAPYFTQPIPLQIGPTRLHTYPKPSGGADKGFWFTELTLDEAV